MTFSELTIGHAFIRRNDLLCGNLEWVSSVSICVKHTDTMYRVLGRGWALTNIPIDEEVIFISDQERCEFMESMSDA